MNTTNRFFRKYMISSILILLGFIIVNIVLFFGVSLLASETSAGLNIPVSQIADGIRMNEQGAVIADDLVIELLSKEASFAMVLNEAGTVVWEHKLPKDLLRQYSASDIARFSRWYLDDYPVLVQALSPGLLVVGYPPESIIKLNHVTTTDLVHLAVVGSFLIITINFLLIVILFWHNTRRVEKAVVPILNGIEAIAQGNAVCLPENGELSEINVELNRTGEHILRKDKARAEWINGVSHDIRTPLSMILGYAGEIEDNSTLPDATQAQAGIIRKQGEKLRSFIADLNLTSKLEYSMHPLRSGTIYPVELTRQVITDFLNNGLSDKYYIDFDVALDDESITLQGDSSLLTRMLCNLIHNSISHNPQGCHITITVCKSDKTLEFIIRDNGIGISESLLKQLNANSFSAPDCSENGEMAHGFGLRLVYQIVFAHKGTISFKTNKPTGVLVRINLNL